MRNNWNSTIRKRCSRRGSKSCLTRRRIRICPGRCGRKCCATSRAISCSTISAPAKTIRRPACVPTAPTSSTSCAPISPTRWDCRSAIRTVRAAWAAEPPKCYQWFDIEHPEVTRPPPPPEQQDVLASASPAAATPPPPPPTLLGGLFNRSQSAAAVDAPADGSARDPSGAAEAEAPDHVRRIFAGCRRRRAYRRGTRGGERRQHRFLYRPADAAVVAPRHGLCRPLRPRADAGASGAGVERHAGRLPGRRCRARRIDHAQAVLARQFPVRA